MASSRSLSAEAVVALALFLSEPIPCDFPVSLKANADVSGAFLGAIVRIFRKGQTVRICGMSLRNVEAQEARTTFPPPCLDSENRGLVDVTEKSIEVRGHHVFSDPKWPMVA